MANKLMYITNDEIQNYPICKIQLMVLKCLDTQLNKQTNQNSLKFPKVIMQPLL